MLKNWISNIKNGLKLLIGAPVERQHFHVSLAFMLLALGISLSLFAILDYLQLDHVRFQDVRGTAILGAFFAIAALLAIIAAHLENDYPQLPVLLTIALSSLPWIAILVSLFPFDWAVANHAGWLLAALLAFCAAALIRCLKLAFYRPNLLTLISVVLGFVIVSVFSWNRLYFPSVFDAYNPEEFDDQPYIDVEHTLYHQRSLLNEKLKIVVPSAIGTTDYFFVGFGGSDLQTVFESETLYANELIGDLYNTQNRSLVLFNNADKLDEQPIANTYNLQNALYGVAQKMTVDEDVLILLLTSHGGDDATLSVDLQDVPLKLVDADELKATLDLARIKWRIIIISACYSGSFIDTLEDENTLLITAASADRNSFGCSSDRELTVFGDAFFKQSLSQDRNWVTAFEQARKLIKEWETEAEAPYSNPQIRLGNNARLKLGLPVPPSIESETTN